MSECGLIVAAVLPDGGNDAGVVGGVLSSEASEGEGEGQEEEGDRRSEHLGTCAGCGKGKNMS